MVDSAKVRHVAASSSEPLNELTFATPEEGEVLCNQDHGVRWQGPEICILLCLVILYIGNKTGRNTVHASTEKNDMNSHQALLHSVALCEQFSHSLITGEHALKT